MLNWIGNWLLSLIGKRTRGTVTFRCENPECKHEHTAHVWCRPGESAWDAMQREVLAEFDKQDKRKKNA